MGFSVPVNVLGLSEEESFGKMHGSTYQYLNNFDRDCIVA